MAKTFIFQSQILGICLYIVYLTWLFIYTYCLQIHIVNLGEENETFSELIDIKEPKSQKRNYNPEPTIISGPGSPECKKRKYNPEPADELTSSLDDIDFSEFDLEIYWPWDCSNLFVIFSTIFTLCNLIIVPDE